MTPTHTIQTPINSVGAVSIIAINSADLTQDLTPVFKALNIPPLPLGSIRLTKILNLDDALIANFDSSTLLIMPHGGIAITHAISQALTTANIPLTNQQNPQTTYPEATDIHEARMLAALSTAPSPLAVDLLLDQPNRWRAMNDQSNNPADLANAAQLNHLLTPPIVVALGKPNIGKSSLINALAGDSIAIVSNHPGTTRDHLGVMLNLAGLVVRWIDTPGIDQSDQSIQLGDELNLLTPIINTADLIIHATDSQSKPIPLDPRLANQISPTTPILQIAIRADLAIDPASPTLRCSAKTGQGIQKLTTAIKNQLIPGSTLTDPRPWRFWDSS